MESTAIGVLLTKFGAAIAAFCGAVGSLMFIKEITRLQVVVSIPFGFACAWYISPLLLPTFMSVLSLDNKEEALAGLAFLTGLFSMSIVPFGNAFIERFIAKQGA